MITIERYVPILRWKQAEQRALSKLERSVYERITPFFEFIMPSPKIDAMDPKSVLLDSKGILLGKIPSIAKVINESFSGKAAFIDVHLIDEEVRSQMLERILNDSFQLEPKLIPSIYLPFASDKDADIRTSEKAIIFSKSSKHGLCIRINRFQLSYVDNISDLIIGFIEDNDFSMRDLDFLIDLEIVTQDDSPTKIMENINSIFALKDDPRSLVLAGGAFPENLSNFEKHTEQEIPRLEWQLWQECNELNKLKCKLHFSDYTIQHPLYITQKTSIINASASIRYTDVDSWQVLRGEGLRNKNGAGFAQYPALASILSQADFYKGEYYSAGDKYIAEKASKIGGTGNPATWLQAGINHHITLVVNQFSNSS